MKPDFTVLIAEALTTRPSDWLAYTRNKKKNELTSARQVVFNLSGGAEPHEVVFNLLGGAEPHEMVFNLPSGAEPHEVVFNLPGGAEPHETFQRLEERCALI